MGGGELVNFEFPIDTERPLDIRQGLWPAPDQRRDLPSARGKMDQALLANDDEGAVLSIRVPHAERVLVDAAFAEVGLRSSDFEEGQLGTKQPVGPCALGNASLRGPGDDAQARLQQITGSLSLDAG